ncbi:MAG: DUF1553 domain-containing protein [Planctomycetota bacterium]
MKFANSISNQSGHIWLIILLQLMFVVPSVGFSQETQPSSEETFDHHGQSLKLPVEVTFNAHVRGIMSNTCFVCHGPDEENNESGLRLDSFTAAVDDGGAIEPGDATESKIYQRIVDADDPMPPAEFRHQLTEFEKAMIRRWIEQGAKYQQHWAYTPVSRPQPPQVDAAEKLSRNAIDAFVFAKLKQNGMSPAPEADKATLLRRLSLDLTGLPPSPSELAAFQKDESADAYEQQVDRLLASPHFGERMAAFWLDIVRFSDTVGYHGDQNQRIFPYRDYVIKSINSNQPFDQFTREQLAGDLLENPTVDQLTATGLIRLNMVTREGGAQPGEYLAKYTADRVRMLGTAWLGATTGCCECHNHKYDPYTIEDFYSLGAYFDDVRQWGVYSNYGYTPNSDLAGFNNNFPFPPEMRRTSDSLRHQIEFLEKQYARVSARQLSTDPTGSEKFQQWLKRCRESMDLNSKDLWRMLQPNEVLFKLPEAHEILDDGSVLFSEPPKASQAVSISTTLNETTLVRSIQLQVLPDDRHDGHVGRGKEGRFSADVSFQVLKAADKDKLIDVRPRFVRFELANTELSFAEVEVFVTVDGQQKNIARTGKATQSSTAYDGEAARAIDGVTDGDYHKSNSVTHTSKQANNWWELDLGSEQNVDEIKIWNRTDGDYAKRLKNVRLILLNAKRQTVFQTGPKLPKPSTTVEVPETVPASELVIPENVAFALADRWTPRSYSSGQPPRYLEGTWRSGPSRWQLPDETKLPHTAVYHLNRAITIEKGDQLVVKINSSDVGKVRLAISPFSRLVCGGSATNDVLRDAIQNADLADATVKQELLGAYKRYLTPFNKQANDVTMLRHELADCRSGLAMTMISQPLADDQYRQSRVLPRGDWQDESGNRVMPNTPHFLPGHNSDNDQAKRQTRLDLADWLTSPKNPLTARHYVNRVWGQFFGNGLSTVIDDLGNQGEWPSHPELLDWLASEFKSDWNRKRLIRLIVTSHTYRQRVAIDQAQFEADPYNRLLAHQSARRLEAEIIRDNALSIAGLLNTEWIGGPSVFPYQPPGYYSNLQFPNRRYVADTDGRQYRRGIYMHWQRTFLHPMLTNFDAPARDECVAKRTLSNSPQQALTLLNDPVFVEAARAFAVRVIRESKSADISDRIKMAFQLAVNRDPQPAELESLSKLFTTQRTYFTENPTEAERFEAIGQFDMGEKSESSTEVAALAQVCRVLLNLHETITRY